MIPFIGWKIKLKLVSGSKIRCYLLDAGYQGVRVLIGNAKGVFHYSEIKSVKRRWL